MVRSLRRASVKEVRGQAVRVRQTLGREEAGLEGSAGASRVTEGPTDLSNGLGISGEVT